MQLIRGEVEASSRRDVRPKKEALKSDSKHTGIQRADYHPSSRNAV